MSTLNQSKVSDSQALPVYGSTLADEKSTNETNCWVGLWLAIWVGVTVSGSLISLATSVAVGLSDNTWQHMHWSDQLFSLLFGVLFALTYGTFLAACTGGFLIGSFGCLSWVFYLRRAPATQATVVGALVGTPTLLLSFAYGVGCILVFAFSAWCAALIFLRSSEGRLLSDYIAKRSTGHVFQFSSRDLLLRMTVIACLLAAWILVAKALDQSGLI